MDKPNNLDEIRNNINHVDSDILKLLSKRRKLSEEVDYF